MNKVFLISSQNCIPKFGINIKLRFQNLREVNNLDKQFRYQNLKFLYEKKLGCGYKNNKISLEIDYLYKELNEEITIIGVTKSSFESNRRYYKKRLEYTDINSLKVISEWDKNKTEKYAKDILGSIDYEQSELDKLTDYIMKSANRNNCG